jgi:hypothetical protein
LISVTDPRYSEIDRQFRQAFGNGIPLMLIPDGETIEGLSDKVNRSVQEGKTLLPRYYDWFEGQRE